MKRRSARERLTRWLHRTGLVAGFLVLCGGSTGCLTPQARCGDCKSPNVFVWSPMLPPDVRRVGILPLTCEVQTLDHTEGREALQPILETELVKARRFEVVAISPEALETRTGRACWRQEENLPSDLFDWLKTSSGCDAVLFCHLTVFHPYPPVQIGWRMRLVDLRTRTTLWAADQVFEAHRQPLNVHDLYRRCYGLVLGSDSPDGWLLLNSPRRFGQYAAAQVFSSLPEP